MSILKYVLAVIAGLIVGGIVWAANVFPTSLNVWEYGEVIEEDWANSLEETIGITNSSVITSHDYLIRQRLTIGVASSTFPSFAYASSTYYFQREATTTMDAWLAKRSTTNLAEGSNLYYTTVRDMKSNWQFYNTSNIRPTSTVGIIVSASSTFAGDLSVGNNTLFIDDAGRIGIATTTPRYTLDVWGSLAVGTTTSPLIYADAGNSLITLGGDMSVGTLQIDADSGVVTLIDMSVTSGASAGTEESYSFNLDASSTPTMIIYGQSDGSGGIRNQRVGIATTTPEERLSVQGTIKGSKNIILYGTDDSIFGGGFISQASSTFNSTVDFSGGTVTGMNLYPSFTYVTTTWSGTTTVALGVAYIAETWSGVSCFTNVGNVAVRFGDGTNKMNWVLATTTPDFRTLSTNNSFTTLEKRYVELGSPETAPTSVSCTIKKVY